MQPLLDDGEVREKSLLGCAFVALVLCVLALCCGIFFVGYNIGHMSHKFDTMLVIMGDMQANTRNMCYNMAALTQTSNVTCR